MLDIRLIREQPVLVKSRLATRGGEDAAKVDEVLRVDAERRKAETTFQQLNADRKRLSKEIGWQSRGVNLRRSLEDEVRKIGEQIALLTEQTAKADELQKYLLLQIPNLPTQIRRSEKMRVAIQWCAAGAKSQRLTGQCWITSRWARS